jgi:predicted  nucleic acid-binding Zn-ribbon protein
MDPHLQRLQELQGLDTRIAGLERKLEAIPVRIQGIKDDLQRAKTAFEQVKAKAEQVRKDVRFKEKDVEVQQSQRAKLEAKLYEVKTNKEYSAVLSEIETSKAEKGRLEEEVLALMELGERLGPEVVEAEARFRRQTEEAQAQERAAAEEQRALDADLQIARAERESLARDVPRDILAQYDRLLKGRGGLAVALVGQSRICGGCRVTLTPQRFQEIRQSNQILTCESCGRILYYQA